jgi:hypothetical protein
LDQYAAARATRVGFWPTTGSIQVIVGEDRKPTLVFTKDRFSFSEASSYYEFHQPALASAEAPKRLNFSAETCFRIHLSSRFLVIESANRSIPDSPRAR